MNQLLKSSDKDKLLKESKNETEYMLAKVKDSIFRRSTQ